MGLGEMLISIFYRLVLLFVDGFNFGCWLVCCLLSGSLRRHTHRHFSKADITIFEDYEGTPTPQQDGSINSKQQKRSWDMAVHSKNFFARLCGYRTLGFGEMYVEGLWDVEDLEELMYRIFSTDTYAIFFNPWFRFLNYLQFNLFNLQTKAKAWEVGKEHYDLGNSLFESMLDETMTYSCGYWKTATNLEQAQLDKMDLIARKLKLQPGMRVLDVGCGWGGLCKYLAENYGVSVMGCTNSKESAHWAIQQCKGLDVDIRTVDYRDVDEKFDRIVTVGFFEHVGHKNYRTFFAKAHSCLKEDGLLLVHTIGINHTKMPHIEPWFNRYIFVNGMLPRPSHIIDSSKGLFILEDWQNLGIHYLHTLRAWFQNFDKNWPKLKESVTDPEKFYRTWSFYLKMSAAVFRARRFHVWQLVMTKDGMMGGYEAPR